MISDLGKTQWLPQIDINADEAQATRDNCGLLKERSGSNSSQRHSV